MPGLYFQLHELPGTLDPAPTLFAITLLALVGQQHRPRSCRPSTLTPFVAHCCAQADNASLMGAMKLACSELGLQPVEPFLDKVCIHGGGGTPGLQEPQRVASCC
jgi:hypothetical protein